MCSTPPACASARMARGVGLTTCSSSDCGVKYEDINLGPRRTRALQAGLTRYVDFYNQRRIHQSHDYQTPDEIDYATSASEPLAIAA